SHEGCHVSGTRAPPGSDVGMGVGMGVDVAMGLGVDVATGLVGDGRAGAFAGAAPVLRLAAHESRGLSVSRVAALALASVVLIRSCSISSLLRSMSRDLRCAESRLSLCLVFLWRMGSRSLSQEGSQCLRL